MGTRNPEDPKIRLARAQERLKNTTQQNKVIDKLTAELKVVIETKHTLHEELEIEKRKSEFLQIALEESKAKLVEKHEYSRKIAIISDVFFLISNILVAWGVNYISSTPRNDTGFILIGAGAIIFIVNVISSKVLASGGDLK